MDIESSIMNYLSHHKTRLMQDYHLISIGLFGSIARGDSNNRSDIDLVIEFEPDTPDIYSLKSRLRKEIETQFDRNVDICRLKYIKPIFKDQIQAEIKYV
jgi:uncharacterized protein